jgi:hypothetical protein
MIGPPELRTSIDARLAELAQVIKLGPAHGDSWCNYGTWFETLP